MCVWCTINTLYQPSSVGFPPLLLPAHLFLIPQLKLIQSNTPDLQSNLSYLYEGYYVQFLFHNFEPSKGYIRKSCFVCFFCKEKLLICFLDERRSVSFSSLFAKCKDTANRLAQLSTKTRNKFCLPAPPKLTILDFITCLLYKNLSVKMVSAT